MPGLKHTSSGEGAVVDTPYSTANGFRWGAAEPQLFREAMSRFPSGVVIVTTHDEALGPVGFTASSFCSVSLEPPLVLVCLAESANCYPAFLRAERFAVSILASSHVPLAKWFATKRANKFPHPDIVEGPRGMPVVNGALAVVTCVVEAQHAGGDHTILVGRAQEIMLSDGKSPTVYFNRSFRTLLDCEPM